MAVGYSSDSLDAATLQYKGGLAVQAHAGLAVHAHAGLAVQAHALRAFGQLIAVAAPVGCECGTSAGTCDGTSVLMREIIGELKSVSVGGGDAGERQVAGLVGAVVLDVSANEVAEDAADKHVGREVLAREDARRRNGSG